MGPNEERAFSGTFLTNYSTMDYNAYYRNEKGFRWRSPDNDDLNNADESELQWKEAIDLKSFSMMTGWEEHGIQVDYSILQKVTPPDPAKKGTVYPKDGTDFRLVDGSNAVDAGIVLPNINDHFSGKAPDMGALETGNIPVVYGARKKQ